MTEVKTCPLCSQDAALDAAKCACGYRFSGFSTADEDDIQEGMITNPRPTGVVPMTIGWICFAAAVLLIFISLGSQPENYEISPYASPSALASGAEKLAKVWLLQMTAAGFFSLFLVLWSVGYIVKAMSFLPGKDDAN